ncbi:DUF58 domain-containing protein [Rhodobacter capsulatus]|uniref:DUF58 domain-containing protein n=1 Tax=Rhodobacter capsulatus (strain ATCC BAA-309 / NBRC 16581 / SB1003) TaxID=272942 RepID=D5ANK6_RHOCB|nr:DUF58 domain-containing protein [Rhodobacter capsulatus]ADE84360.1 protein of unknown function DUF58 [Rhodobacter capsulatus SB 1003]ETD02676.1 hypothetical protein U714_03850 [Rhodobacter capsulatus DE442]ETD78832.1 hypothetical protein U717_03860 [Rhodobacter capsulatus R121]ETE54811.1 hypothetical protein U715_03850 [Rhodobacter capsulatus Y262]MDS0926043.1 DUF58 domain-containing protein [Rhodobacter capsulatus]
MSDPLPDAAARDLRRAAEAEAAALPALLIAAEHLANTVQMGGHGRRRAGAGEEFWQYRPAHSGDEARFVDWRRSARSDAQFVRDREAQLAQSLCLWVDPAASMRFSGAETGRKARPEKQTRARLLVLALAISALRAGERVGLASPLAPPRPGRAQLLTLAQALLAESSAQDHVAPDLSAVAPQARLVLLSDFFADPAALEAALAGVAGRGVTGVLLQVLDPAEEDFPYDGRTVFTSMAGGLRFETREAGDLRARYRARLAERRDRIARIAERAGFAFSSHHTGVPAQAALLWLHGALAGGWR